jgi:hypothetical protein
LRPDWPSSSCKKIQGKPKRESKVIHDFYLSAP